MDDRVRKVKGRMLIKMWRVIFIYFLLSVSVLSEKNCVYSELALFEKE